MKIQRQHFIDGAWKLFSGDATPGNCQLVLAFGSPAQIADPSVYSHLKNEYPLAQIVMASTAGEIMGNAVYDDSVAVTAIEFEKTEIRVVSANVKNFTNSLEAGKQLLSELDREDLAGIYVISDGTIVDGDELVEGLRPDREGYLPITGGFAGDALRFEKTLTGLNGPPSQGNIVAVGLYGKNIAIGYGSLGGWSDFGFERNISRSDKNVLYELDNRNALDLYKEFLGSYAEKLPGSALMFPLSMKVAGSDKNVIRTILAVDEEKQSMIFAGNVPKGSKVKMMHGNFEKLVKASATATEDALREMHNIKPQLALLVSCVGRKIILDKVVTDEVDVAVDILGTDSIVAGFYSYGGISPMESRGCCQLHNQTMTVTTFSEF